MKRTRLAMLLRALSGLFLLASAGALWLAGTQSGLRALLALSSVASGIELRAERIAGSLADGARLDRVEAVGTGFSARAAVLRIRCDCALALFGVLRLPELTLEQLRMDTAPEAATSDGGIPVLPFTFDVERLQLLELHWNGRRLLRRGAAGVIIDGNGLAASDVELAGPDWRLRQAGTLRLARDARLSGSIAWDAVTGDAMAAYGKLRAAGDLRQLRLDISVLAPLPARIEAEVRDAIAAPQWRAAVSADWTSLHRLYEPLPAGAELRLQLNASGQNAEWQATGAARVRGATQGDPATAIELELSGHGSLRGDQPAGIVAGWRGSAWRALGVDLEAPQGTLRADRSGGRWRIVLDSSLATRGGPPGTLYLEVDQDAADWRISTARIELDGAGIEARGALRGDAAGRAVEVDATWRQLRLAGGTGTIDLADGRLAVRGVLPEWNIDAEGSLAGSRLPAGRFELSGRGRGAELELDRLRLDWAGGTVAAHGDAAWHGGPDLALSFSAMDLDPGRHWRGWNGNLDLHGDLHWQPDAAALRAAASGTLRGQAVAAQLALRRRGDDLRVDEFSIRSGSARARVAGRIGATAELDWDIDAPDLAALLPGGAGAVTGSGRLAGARAELAAGLRGTDIVTPWLSAKRFALDAELVPGAERISLQASMDDLELRGQRLHRIEAQLGGTREQHEFSISAQAAHGHLTLGGDGALDHTGWRAQLHELDLQTQALGDWRLERALQFAAAAGRLTVKDGCIVRAAARVCPGLDLDRDGGWAAKLDAVGLPLELFAHRLPDALRLQGLLAIEALAHGQWLRLADAEARLRTSAVQVEVVDAGAEPYRVAIARGTGQLHYADAVLQSELDLEFDDPVLRPLRARIALEPVSGWPPDAATARLRGTVAGGISDIGFLAATNPRLAEVAGSVTLDMELSGSLAEPALNGEFLLADAGLRLPDLGTQLHDVRLQGRELDGRAMSLSGRAQSGAGTVRFDGRVVHEGGDTALNLVLGGERFELLNLPEAWVLVAPALEVELRDRVAFVSGTLRVDEARIDLEEVVLDNALSPDVVVAGEKTPAGQTRAGRAGAGIRIELGDRVHITGHGLSGRLEGALELDAPAGRRPLANGEIRIVDGRYSAYGQSLDIVQGRILYRRAELDNPDLSIRAVRRIGSVTAGVEVTGNLAQPRVALYSSPSMNQEQTLAHVVFGRPLTDLTSSDGSSLVAAATALGLQNSGFLTSSLSSTFGLDELSVEANAATQSASLIIGKYLTPRLYLGYGLGMAQALDTMRLRYDISDKWAVQAERSEEVGVDLFYKINR